MTETLGSLYQKTRARMRLAFAKDDLASPDLDVRLLISATLGLCDHAPLTQGERVLSDSQCEKIDRVVVRRLSGEPVSRILGEQYFWGLRFKINEHTLVPRPETEGLVETVLTWVDERGWRERPLRLADLGTGSGAVLIALLHELPEATGIGVDISEPALQVAVVNADAHGVGGRFHPVISDYGEAVSGRFDIVVSNPPYIATHEKDCLMQEVAAYDPALALFGGDDGLDAYRKLLPWCAEHLIDEGLIVLEHGYQQSEDVICLAQKGNFKRTQCVLDITGLPRFAKIQKKTAISL